MNEGTKERQKRRNKTNQAERNKRSLLFAALILIETKKEKIDLMKREVAVRIIIFVVCDDTENTEEKS